MSYPDYFLGFIAYYSGFQILWWSRNVSNGFTYSEDYNIVPWVCFMRLVFCPIAKIEVSCIATESFGQKKYVASE